MAGKRGRGRGAATSRRRPVTRSRRAATASDSTDEVPQDEVHSDSGGEKSTSVAVDEAGNSSNNDRAQDEDEDVHSASSGGNRISVEEGGKLSNTDKCNSSDEGTFGSSDSSESSTFESLSFQSQYSMSKMMDIISSLTEAQQKLVKNIGFGSLLELKCSRMPLKKFVVWLALKYDSQTKSIKIGQHAFKIDGQLVHWILGIPFGGSSISRKPSSDAKAIISGDTTPGPQAPKIQDLLGMITLELLGDRFVRVFMLAVLPIFLCPSSATRASSHYYNGIQSIKKIKSYDWCDAVASCLTSGLENFQLTVKKSPKGALAGCLFVLFTAYFDYLGSEMNIVPQTIPHISAWTDEYVEKYIAVYPKFRKMEIKEIELTAFANAPLKRTSKRSHPCDDSNDPRVLENVAAFFTS